MGAKSSCFHFQIRLKESQTLKPVVYDIWHLKSIILMSALLIF